MFPQRINLGQLAIESVAAMDNNTRLKGTVSAGLEACRRGRRRVWSETASLLLLLALPCSATALQMVCDDTIEEEVEQVDAIVAADVLHRSRDETGHWTVTFRVLRQWKGVPMDELAMSFAPPAPFEYEDSGFYLIYANSFDRGGEREWYPPWCGGVRDLAYEGERLEFLEGWVITSD